MSLSRSALVLVAAVVLTGCGQLLGAATGGPLPARDDAFCAELSNLQTDVFDLGASQETLDALLASARDPELKQAIQQVVDASRSAATVDLSDTGAVADLVTSEAGDVASATQVISRYLAACEVSG